MAIPDKNDLIGSAVTEAQFKLNLGSIVDFLKYVENQSPTYATTALLTATIPSNSPSYAKALDTGKVWYWNKPEGAPNGNYWSETSLSDFDQAKLFATIENFKNLALNSSFYIDEYTRTGTAATGNGDLFAIQLKQRDVVINEIMLKTVDVGGLTSFSCALYIVDSSMKVVTVLSTHDFNVAQSDIYKITGLNITVPNGLYLAVGMQSGVKLAHKTSGVTQTNGFFYSQNIANVLNLAVGYKAPTMQNLNTYISGIGIKATGTTLPSDYSKLYSALTVNDAILYDYSAYALSNSQANGEFWTIKRDFPNAISISSLTVNLKSLINTAKTTFKVRPMFKHKTTNLLVSVGEVIEFTIQSGVTQYTAQLDLTFPPDTYFSLGVEAGVNIGYYSNATAGSFGYSSNTSLGISGKVGNNLPDLQTISGAVAIALTVKTRKFFDFSEYLKRSELPSGSLANYLYGKKIVAIGDSMVQGHSLSDAANQTWLAKLANRNNMTRVNYGINGTYLSNKLYGTYDGAVIRYTQMANDADYIIVFAGANDARNSGVPMGTDDSTDNTTFKGALNVLCDGLITKYPNKKIGFITPYLRDANYPAYIEAIKTICKKYSIPVFDNSEKGGVCWTNSAQLTSITLNDTYHLNEAGMDYASYKYEAFIRSL